MRGGEVEASSGDSTLIATTRCSVSSNARTTMPKPPRPSTSSTSCWFNRPRDPGFEEGSRNASESGSPPSSAPARAVTNPGPESAARVCSDPLGGTIATVPCDEGGAAPGGLDVSSSRMGSRLPMLPEQCLDASPQPRVPGAFPIEDGGLLDGIPGRDGRQENRPGTRLVGVHEIGLGRGSPRAATRPVASTSGRSIRIECPAPAYASLGRLLPGVWRHISF